MRLSKIAMAGAFAALLAVASHGLAEGNAATGSVSGRVTTPDQKPAANATVKIVSDSKAHKPDKTAADGEKPKKDKAAGPSYTGTTDADGKFTIDNIPPGQYTVTAVIKDVGRARSTISVAAGKTAEVVLQMQKPKAKS